MFKFKAIIKYHLCCKYHKGLPELCESLTEENNNLKADNNRLRPTEEHVFSGCVSTDTNGVKTSTDICLKCGEYKPYAVYSKVKCITNYKRLYAQLDKNWSKTLIPADTYEQFQSDYDQRQKKKKDNEELNQLRKCLREPVCLIK